MASMKSPSSSDVAARVLFRLSCVIALISGWPAEAADGILLAENGVARAVIVVQEDAPDSVQFAACELQHHVELVSGARLNIRNMPVEESGMAAILLGAHPAAMERGWSAADFAHDEFRIVSEDACIGILGHDYGGPPIHGYRNPWNPHEVYNPELKLGAFGDCGTLYGVYRFLETVCGVRWYMPGDLGVVARPRSTIEVASIDLRAVPDFEYRYRQGNRSFRSHRANTFKPPDTGRIYPDRRSQQSYKARFQNRRKYPDSC